jgi:pilus assembly protein CpaC
MVTHRQLNCFGPLPAWFIRRTGAAVLSLAITVSAVSGPAVAFGESDAASRPVSRIFTDKPFDSRLNGADPGAMAGGAASVAEPAMAMPKKSWRSNFVKSKEAQWPESEYQQFDPKTRFQSKLADPPSRTPVSLTPRQLKALEERLATSPPTAGVNPEYNRALSKALPTRLSPPPVPSQDLASAHSTQPKMNVIEQRSGGYVFQQLEEDPATGRGSSPTKALKGSITTLNVTKGRSQLIKFAQPIARMAIADPTLADLVPLSPEQLMINGKQRGVTSLIVWDKNGQEGIFDLQVTTDNTPLLEAIQAIAPNERIEARITDDSFVVSGQVSNTIILDEIRRLAAAYGYKGESFIDLTETPTPQVILEVKIAEAARSVVDELNTSFSFVRGDFRVARVQTIPAPIPAAGSTVAPPAVNTIINPNNNFFNNQPVQNTGGIFGALLPLARTNFNLQTAFDFLETIGKVTTLANPTLVCTHGREASFLAGGEFPFAQGTDQNGSPLISFKDFGVKLNFTPWIATRTRRIELKVAPEVSQLDNSTCITGQAGQPVCGLTKRSSSTVVELNDGETLMISGLISRDEQKNYSAVPYISNVPILGALFKNPRFQRRESEMVVLVTPHIVDAKDYGRIMAGPG